MVVSNHWTGILEWTTGLTFFWFYTFSALSDKYDTKKSVISQMDLIKCILFIALWHLLYSTIQQILTCKYSGIPKNVSLTLRYTRDYCDTTFYNIYIYIANW